MNNYNNDDTFEFGNTVKSNDFSYEEISGLGQSNYENEDLFNTEVSNNNEQVNPLNVFETQVPNENLMYGNVEVPVGYGIPNLHSENENSGLVNNETEKHSDLENFTNYNENMNPLYEEENTSTTETSDNVETNNDISYTNENIANENQQMFNDSFDFEQVSEEENTEGEEFVTEEVLTQDVPVETNEAETENVVLDTNEVVEEAKDSVDTQFLDNSYENFSLGDNYNLPIVEPTVQPEVIEEKLEESKQNILSETPIEELSKLTEYSQEKVETTDIKSLFDRVGVNVKEASDIFRKNTEMKEKIDSRFEELKKLQSEVEKAKKTQYDEINSYKEEVLGKLTEKKEEIERRINKLKDFQASLEKEKEEFEAYRKREKEEIEKVQKEVQDAYDSRREELNHIEDVLRKQKDSLDEERSQLSLDRIQYESDKNELANNLLKFNEIVDSFTNGMNKLEKESE